MEARARTAVLPLVLITSLFFLWGVANNLNDVLIPQFRKAFSLTDFQSGLVQSAFYMGYFLLALPAGLFMRRFGYKNAVVLGLCLYGVGALLFYPAAEFREYAWFLGALFVIASGLAFLETSANPLVTVLGDPATSERRLNFAQAFNPFGAIAGVLIGRQFILSGVEHTEAEMAAMDPAQLNAFYNAEAQAVQTPYLILGLGVLAWAVVIALTRFPEVATRHSDEESQADDVGAWGSVRAVLARPRFLFSLLAQFCYVGAQVGVWSFMIRYAQANVDGMPEKTAATYLTWSLVGFMVGRFTGTALMGRVPPGLLMGLFGVVNIALTLFAVAVPGHTGLLALAATSFFMSIMFPTIFAMGVKGLGPLTKTGASFLVMTIIGGAVFTAIMGAISDSSGIHMAMAVPAFCFAIVAAFGFTAKLGRDEGAVPEGAPA